LIVLIGDQILSERTQRSGIVSNLIAVADQVYYERIKAVKGKVLDRISSPLVKKIIYGDRISFLKNNFVSVDIGIKNNNEN